MGSHHLLCITWLVGCTLANAGRLDHAEIVRVNQALQETVKATVAIDSSQLTQLMTTAAGLITSTVSGFSEDPPDYEYAFESIKSSGWKLVKIIVPDEKQKDKQFRNAGKAWKEAFGDLGELAEDVASGDKNGDDMIMVLVSKGLNVASKAFPDNRKYFDASDKLFHGLVGSLLTFSREMGWRAAASALVEMDGKAKEDVSVSQMLTTGVGLVTGLITTFSEADPDIQDAIDTINLNGWKMVKIMTPKAEQRTPTFKQSKKAWDKVMDEAYDMINDIIVAAQDAGEGYMGKTIEAILKMVNLALEAAAAGLVAEQAFLKSLAEFIGQVGHSILDFSKTMEWIQ